MKRFFFFLLFLIAACSALITRPCRGADASQAPNLGILAPRMQHFVDENVMAGAVMLVGYKDKICDLEPVGYSDLGAKKPMRVDDLFWIASMSKPITAAALMMLVDEGRVGLDDPVAKYIPEFRDVQVAQADGTLIASSHPVLIREILSHTSGLPFFSKQSHGKVDCFTLEQAVKIFAQEHLIYDPGSKWVYSNEGIDTVGRVIEVVSGMPYEKFLQDRLLTPLGMVDTTFFPSPAQIQRLAKSYQTKADKSGIGEAPIVQLTYPLDAATRHPSPPGGLFSTAHDLYRFCQMLADGGTLEGRTYLSKDAVHQMTIKQTGPKNQEKYGFGMQSATDGHYFGHGGAYKTSMNIDTGKIVIFLVQQGPGGWLKGDPNKEFSGTVSQLVDVRQTGRVDATHRDIGTPIGMQAPPQ
jgi:CubicO group peptidase (beta-lactamase class C family)